MGAKKNGIRRPSRVGRSRLLLQKQETARVKRLLDQIRKNELSELENVLADQVRELQRQLTEQKELPSANDARLRELEAEVQAFQEQKATMARLQAEAQAWMMGERERELGRLEKQVAEQSALLETQLAQHAQETEKLLAEQAALREELARRCSEDQEAVDKLRAAKFSLEEQMRSLEGDLSGVQTDLVSAQERIAELERELIEAPERAREKFELEKQHLIEEQATLMATLAEESVKRRELEEQVARASDLSLQLEKMATALSERDEARAELESSRADVARLEARVRELEKQILEVEKKGKAALEKEIEANDRVVLKLEEEIAARDKRIAELGS